MAAPTPVFIPRAFGASAAPQYITQPPNTNDPATGRASFQLGFPPLTMTPIVAGGKPPFGQDVNGVLNMLSQHVVAFQAGTLPKYSAQVAAAIGGYGIGACVTSTDGYTLWYCVNANNSTDPDAGGNGWVPVYSFGYSNIAGLTGGTRTLTQNESARAFITLEGTLAANQAVVLPNNRPGPWTFINLTTGAFSLTVRTAAGGGVVIPQGGYGGPVSVYGDATNIQPMVTPLTIPTAVGPTPDTYALRSNAGYLYATYFNQVSGTEGGAIGAVMFRNDADTFVRAMAFTDFRAAINTSPALTGVPTAPTAAVGTATDQIATTAFVTNRNRVGAVSAGGVAQVPFPAGWAVVRTNTGRYTVTHNLGTQNYAVAASLWGVAAPSRVQVATTNGPNSFTVQWYSQTDGVYSDQPFQFILSMA